MSDPRQPQDATAALAELENQLAGGKASAPVEIDAATAVAAAAATAVAPAPAPAATRTKQAVPVQEAPKKKKKSRRVFFEGGPSRRLEAFRKRFGELVAALSSPDRPTRQGARYFFASLAGLVLVLGVAGHRYSGHLNDLRARAGRIARQQNAVLAEFLRKRSEIAKRRNSMLLLGGFNLALQPEPGARQPSSYRLAEVELVVECDSKESRDFLEEHLAQARNEVTNTFVKVDRAELMTSDGKMRLKRALQERLNLLLPKGRVESVYFSRLVLT